MQSNENNIIYGKKAFKRKYKKALMIIAAVMVIALCTYIVVQIYVTKTMTWDDVYDVLGLETTGAVDGEVSVNILDVGQGDCTVIIAGGQVVMIDASERSASDEILAFLDRNGIKRIDYLIATHPHADHIGGMQAVVEHCEIGQVIFSAHPQDITPTINLYLNLLDALLEREIPVRTAKEGEKITLERGTLTVLSDGSAFDDLNDCSIILRYDYGLASFLFMGDSSTKVEKYIMNNGDNVDADVLRAGHHGSGSSTGADFLSEVAPSYVVVSCGIDNSYGHPTKSFIDRVTFQGSRLLRTDLLGDISFVCEGAEPVYLEQHQEAA